MRPKFTLLSLCFSIMLLLLCGWGQDGLWAQRSLVVAEWNLENLFDTLHDEGKQDEAFLPDGEYHWTSGRYWHKLSSVAQAIAALGGEAGLPAVMGLCEVENDTVMRDLTRRSLLRTAGYQYVMTQSADRRGVDVAFLYNPSAFRLLSWHAVRVPSQQHGFAPTRDLLYVCGQLSSFDTLHFVVCHLPSKAGGGRAAARHRQLAVSALRSVVDSTLAISPQAKLVVMGDFNADYTEKIFNNLCPPLLETLPTSRRELNRPVGTYYYQRQWSYLDHILVTPSLQAWQTALFSPVTTSSVPSSPSSLPVPCRSHESRLPFLLNRDGIPNRTFKGTFYNGGLSDHLPLCLTLWY